MIELRYEVRNENPMPHEVTEKVLQYRTVIESFAMGGNCGLKTEWTDVPTVIAERGVDV